MWRVSHKGRRGRLFGPQIVILFFFLLFSPNSSAFKEEFFPESREPYELKADRVEILTTAQGRVSKLKGNLTITHGKTRITAQEGEVYEGTERALLRGNVQIVDSLTTFYAQEALYEMKEKRATLREGVKIIEGDRTITGDRLTYLFGPEEAELFGDVKIIAQKQRLILTGGYGFYERKKERGLLTINPKLILKDEKDGAPVLVTSKKMETFEREKLAIATEEVLIQRGKMELWCNQAIFYQEEGRAILKGNPTVRQEGNRLAGEEMELFFTPEHRLEKALIKGEARVFQDSIAGGSRGKSEMRGEMMTVFLKGEEIEKAVIEGEAQSIYYPSREAGKEEGKNVVKGEMITLLFGKERVKEVRIEGKPEGVYYLPPSLRRK